MPQRDHVSEYPEYGATVRPPALRGARPGRAPDFEGQLVEPAAIGNFLASFSLVRGGGKTTTVLGAISARMGRAFVASLRSIMLAFVPVPMRPNPSLKRSANGRPPGPGRRSAVHFRQPGPGVLPLSPA